MSGQYPLFNHALVRLAVPQAVCRMIVEHHCQPHRHYHTLRHLELMLGELPDNHAFVREMLLATLFHDIVYDPARSDNEEQSLSTFRSIASMFGPDPPVDMPLVSEMILATRSHHFRDEATAGDQAVNLLLKADLSILWHPEAAVYEWYARGVRKEYSFVPEEAFRIARARILTGLRDDLLRSGRLDREEAKVLARNIAWELTWTNDAPA